MSKTNQCSYDNFITGRNLYFDLYYEQYLERMRYARDNGCNSVMLTGDCEPQQNYEFLKLFGIMNKSLDNPFRIVEMQTTGVLLDDDYLYFLRHHVGVTTISLSISSFSDLVNNSIIGVKDEIKDIDLKHLTSRIKKYQFNLRLSINLNEFTFKKDLNDIDKILKMLHNDYRADQLTFRILYESGGELPQDKWVREHKINSFFIDALEQHIKSQGRFLEKLEYGSNRYAINNMSVVIDDDCMSQEAKEALKFLILRPDCHLYTKWDDKGSLLF